MSLKSDGAVEAMQELAESDLVDILSEGTDNTIDILISPDNYEHIVATFPSADFEVKFLHKEQLYCSQEGQGKTNSYSLQK